MKLQGKKTGALANFIGYIDDDSPTVIDPLTGYTLLTVRYKDSGVDCYEDYKTIKEFNEDWEDYKPDEPLIKDEKVRKAVKSWAEVNKIKDDEKVTYQGLYWKLYYQKVGQASIQFNVPLRIADGSYSIEELCGKEEE